nr:formamidase-like isoform X2 [Ipomoea batatas]
MAPSTPKLLVSVDLKKKPREQVPPLHNRWHPEIPPVAEVETGQLFRVEMIDWTGGAVQDNNCAIDVKTLNLSTVHYLSGPIRIVDTDGIPAKPGDLLAVEICNLGPLPGDEWGYTAIFDRENGGGFLTDHFPCAAKAIWYFEGIYAYSPHIPGVRFPGLTHPGIIGTAPSKELLQIWNDRERELEETGPQALKLCEVLHSRPLANLPSTKGCVLGKIQDGTPEWERIALEAARTIPGRENGGNCDIKNLSRGSKIYLPVFIEGANLSTGDMHFSQGDGEVAFCGAIEMSGFLELNVDESGRQHYLDATVAYKRAVLNAIDYLSKFGYSKEQVYLLLSCCPCEGRISGIVDSPNAVATLAIPTAIFDQDIRPKNNKVPVGPRLLRNPGLPQCTYDGDLPITKNPCAST